MATKVIGIKKFRASITSLWKEAKKNQIRYIVMHRNTPIMEVNPISEKEKCRDAKKNSKSNFLGNYHLKGKFDNENIRELAHD